MEQELEQTIKELLRDKKSQEIGKLVSEADKQTAHDINMIGYEYFKEQEYYVEAIFCARNAGETEKMYELFDIREARQMANNYVFEGSGVFGNAYIDCSHATPAGLLNTPHHHMYWLMHEYHLIGGKSRHDQNNKNTIPEE